MKQILAVGLFIILFIASSSAALSQGEIISYYSFDTTGGNEYKDSTGRYNLTNSGGTTTASGKVGTGYYANSAGDYLNITTKPAAIGNLSQLTICGWTKYVTGTGPTIYGVGKSQNRLGIMLYDPEGAWNNAGFFYMDTGSGTAYGYKNNVLYSEDTLTADYGYFCMVFNGSAATNANRQKVYMNNTAITLTFSGTIPSRTPSTFSSGVIGKEPNTPITDTVAYYDEILVFNGSATPTELSCLWNDGDGEDYEGARTCLGLNDAPENFTITAKNAWNSTSLKTFNVTIQAVTYSTDNYTVTTPFLDNATALYNITTSKTGFFSNVSRNRGTTSPLDVELRQSIIIIVVRDRATDDLVTGYALNLSGQTTGTVFYPPPGAHNLRVSKNGYVPNASILTVEALDNRTITIYLERFGFSSVTPVVNNTLGEEDNFTANMTVQGWGSYEHSGNLSASLRYYWQDASGIINVFNTPVESYDSAYYHTCAVRANDSSAWCWGSNAYGRLGTGGIGGTTPIRVSGGHVFKAVSAEFEHTVALRKNDSRAMWWGWDGSTAAASDVPVNVPGGYQFKSVSAGYHSTCGVLYNDSIACWGMGDHGALGNGDTTERLVPTTINSTQRFKSVSTGHYFSCAVSIENKVYCWGWNAVGQLGDGTNTTRNSPVMIASSEDFEKVSVGYHHAAALTVEGHMLVWGWNTDGRNVDGTYAGSTVPKTNTFNDEYSDLQVGDTHICALRSSDEKVYCGGWNWKGEVGMGTYDVQLTAVPVSTAYAFASIQLGHTTSCALRNNDSRMFCWGRNEAGQLGIGSYANSPLPLPVYGDFRILRNGYDTSPKLFSTLPGLLLETPGEEWNFTIQAVTVDGDHSAWASYPFRVFLDVPVPPVVPAPVRDYTGIAIIIVFVSLVLLVFFAATGWKPRNLFGGSR